MPENPDFPLITIGIVVFNRAWIIKRMLSSVMNQTYPHDRIYIIIVDGKSKDDTVKIANSFLAESDFAGYEVIVKESNIPEARNICIQGMKGEYLLFWDSDVLMESNAITDLLDVIKTEKADVVSSSITEVYVNSIAEVDLRWHDWLAKCPKQKHPILTDTACTSNMLVDKKVLNQVVFDPALTFYEDQDFATRATKIGFKIIRAPNIIGFDINTTKQAGSNIYAFDMPLKQALRGIRKKAKIQAENIVYPFPSKRKALRAFLGSNKRYLIYFGYIPALVLTVAGGLLSNLWIGLIFPIYFLIYMLVQFRRRGFIRGLNAAVRSFVVGVPTTYALLFYWATVPRKVLNINP